MKKRLVVGLCLLVSTCSVAACGQQTQEQSAEAEVQTTESADAEQGAVEGESVELQILATSDLHGKFLPWDYALNEESTSGSAAQVATAINEMRTENTIVLDAGDTIQDNSSEIFLEDEVHPMVAALNEIGYDAWTLGNHEFNYGMDVLEGVLAKSEATVLCGNVYSPEGEALGEDYIILDKNGVKVGVIGMVTPNITKWDAINLEGWEVTDPVEETKAAIVELQDEVDVLVAVEHMMVDNEYGVANSGAEDLANACPELDVIIAAHGHQAIDDLEINGVPIVENKNSGSTVAQILMDVVPAEDGGYEVADVSTALVDISTYEADAAFTESMQDYHARAIENAEVIIGEMVDESLAPADEIAGIPTAQIEDTALIDLINEVQMYYTDADVSGAALFINDANMYKGDIRRCDMALIYKYTNTLYKMEMTGEQLLKWMEWSVSYYNTFNEGDLTVSFNENIRGFNYDMFAGVNYEVNLANEPGSRIENVTKADGTPLDPNEVLIVAVNNYRASSQLTSYGEIFQEGEELPKILEIDVRGDIGGVRELIADYIINVKGGVLTSEVDNNWKLTGIDWDEELHQQVVEKVNSGELTLPTSEDGRTPNVKSINESDLK